MLYLLLELCSILVETFGRVPQPQEAVIGRPLKWTQSGSLLSHCRSKSFGGWYNHFQVGSRGSSGLQAHHDVGLYTPIVYPRMSSESNQLLGIPRPRPDSILNLVHANLDLDTLDMHCNFHIHDLDLQDNLDSVHSFGTLNPPLGPQDPKTFCAGRM